MKIISLIQRIKIYFETDVIKFASVFLKHLLLDLYLKKDKGDFRIIFISYIKVFKNRKEIKNVSYKNTNYQRMSTQR